MRGYRTIDYLTQGYVAFTGLVVLLFHGDRLPHWELHFLVHAAVLVAAHVLIRVEKSRPGGLLSFLRAFYPMILYTFFYFETHKLDDLIFRQPFDGVFIGLDRALFGCQPSQVFVRKLPYLAVSEVIYFGYFSYYVMLPGVGLALYFRDRRRFFNYLTVVSFVFYVCYVTYIFLPVRGPYARDVMAPADAEMLGERVVPEQLERGVFYRIMKSVYSSLEPATGAAFPSSHVAAAVTALYFSWRYLKRVRWLHLAAVLLLMVATVYCGYHYVVDVPAGLLTAVILVPIGELIWRAGAPAGADPPLTGGASC